MRRCIAGVAVAAVLLSCIAPLREFYPDTFYKEDAIYENKPLWFSLSFQNGWDIQTDPNAMERSLKKLALSFHKQGIELLFVGSTVDGMQGVQGIAANLNVSANEYAETYRDINKNVVSADSGLTEIIIREIPMVKWVYNKYGYRFIEFFFTIDTYNIRIAFWARPNLFQRFLPVYYSIMASIEFISRY